MADGEGSERTYVITVERVRECIQTLLSLKVHPHFIAYLHLRGMAGRAGRPTGLEPDWASLGERLEVRGAPAEKPFLRPFWNLKREAGQEWLNKNLSGSFSPRSLRIVALNVVEIDAQGRFNLRPRHWEFARTYLLYETAMPVLALGGFILRDYGLITTSPPNPEDLVFAFRSEYGYGMDDAEEFSHLYDTNWMGTEGRWFTLADMTSRATP